MLVKILFGFVVIFLTFCSVKGHTSKSSLAFVVDRTYSMHNIINNIINEIDMVFESVLKSNSSGIDDFVLVVFDDLDVELLARTTDKNIFKTALRSINLKNGGNCPEYSMSGIEAALQFSKPNSYLYVFTNAIAEDYYKIDAVRTLSQERGTQVNFILTGTCHKFRPVQYNVYEDITKETSGQIFHSGKRDVKKIINYIIESIKHKRTILRRTDTEGGQNRIQFTVDSKIRNVLISLSSKYTTNYTLTDLDGKVVETELIVQMPTCTVGKVILKPGLYTVTINNEKTSSVVISGETTFSFQYGFSITKSTDLNKTSSNPVDSPEKQYLAIELDNFESDVRLVTAELTDVDDNIIEVLNLTLVNEEQQFYSTESFKPPSRKFKIAINASTKTNENIRRVSSTTQYWNLKIEAPKIDKQQIIYSKAIGESVNMTCRLKKGKPKPSMTWSFYKDGSGDYEDLKNMQYFYYIKEIDVDHSGFYKCRAINDIGNDYHEMKLEIKRPPSVNLADSVRIEEGKRVTLDCIVDGYPKPSFQWWFNGSKIELSSQYRIFHNNSLSFIGSKSRSGYYFCNAKNSMGEKEEKTKVTVYQPLWIKPPKEIVLYYNVGENIELFCNVSGYPLPNVEWQFKSFKRKLIDSPLRKQKNRNVSSYLINNVQIANQGFYTCTAENEIEKLSIHYEVHVLVKPRIGRSSGTFKGVVGDRALRVRCYAEGSPEPTITWYKDRLLLEKGELYDFENNTLIIKNLNASSQDTYVCKASNILGYDIHTFDVIIKDNVDFSEYNTEVVLAVEGLNKKIQCVSSLTSDVRWYKDGKLYKHGNTLVLHEAKRSDCGIYTCRINLAKYHSYNYYTIKVFVGSEPVFTSDPPKTVQFKEGATVTLDCETRGHPEPSIIWEFDSTLLTNKLMFYKLNMTKENIGTYSCHVQNMFGNVRRTYNIISEVNFG